MRRRGAALQPTEMPLKQIRFSERRLLNIGEPLVLCVPLDMAKVPANSEDFVINLVRDFPRTCFMHFDPAVTYPVAQAHLVFQSGRSWVRFGVK
jgi:hypothetical protein